jgi:hypothetical protein
MKRRLRTLIAVTTTLLAMSAMVVLLALPSLAASGNASCVGTFSTYYAKDNPDVHRSDVAHEFAHDARPAGAIYSWVAGLHGDLDACIAATSS